VPPGPAATVRVAEMPVCGGAESRPLLPAAARATGEGDVRRGACGVWQGEERLPVQRAGVERRVWRRAVTMKIRTGGEKYLHALPCLFPACPCRP